MALSPPPAPGSFGGSRRRGDDDFALRRGGALRGPEDLIEVISRPWPQHSRAGPNRHCPYADEPTVRSIAARRSSRGVMIISDGFSASAGGRSRPPETSHSQLA